jgi:hypothetical protein
MLTYRTTNANAFNLPIILDITAAFRYGLGSVVVSNARRRHCNNEINDNAEAFRRNHEAMWIDHSDVALVVNDGSAES